MGIEAIILGIFTVAVSIGLWIVSNIRSDVKSMTQEIHKFMIQSERRLTLLEARVFQTPHSDSD